MSIGVFSLAEIGYFFLALGGHFLPTRTPLPVTPQKIPGQFTKNRPGTSDIHILLQNFRHLENGLRKPITD